MYTTSRGHLQYATERVNMNVAPVSRKDPNMRAKMKLKKLANRRRKTLRDKTNEPVEDDGSLYVPTASFLVQNEYYSMENPGFCAQAMVPISQIEAVFMEPMANQRTDYRRDTQDAVYGPDNEGDYKYKVKLKSGCELEVWSPMVFREMQAYLFDNKQWSINYPS